MGEKENPLALARVAIVNVLNARHNFFMQSMLTKSSRSNSLIPWRIAILDMLSIASIWCISILIVNPSGNFPLNDDWSYSLTVKHFVENGDFRPIGWTGMALITNVLWGSLFCIIGGFSFTALRLSTLTLSLLGILGVYLLVRDLRQPRWLALIAALMLGFNPIYYALSNTFMTDVPYTAITIFAALFFARSLRNRSDVDLIIGTTLAIAATLSRQLAISIPLAFGLSLVFARGFTMRYMLRATIPLVLCAGALLVFQQLLQHSGRLPSEYALLGAESHYGTVEGLLHELSDLKTLVRTHVLSLTKNTFVGLLYLGLFLSPVLLYVAVDVLQLHKKQVIALLTFTIGTMILVSMVVALHGLRPAVTGAEHYPVTHLMPMSGNILTPSGIGPITLADNWLAGNYVPALPAVPMGFWLVVTAISVLGAGFLIAIVSVHILQLIPKLRLRKVGDNEVVGMFFLFSALIYLAPLFAITFFDRYLVPTIPLFAAGIASLISEKSPRFRLFGTRPLRYSAVALLGAFSLFAIGSTRDYLAWNRVRWEALHDLVENSHVLVGDIDGGFEFNGWYMYDPHYQYDPGKSWWWVQGDTYKICFDGIPGYEVIRKYSYRHLIPPYVGKVVVLRKSA